MTDRRTDAASDLDTLFARAQDSHPLPGGDLMARIEAQALDEQARVTQLRRMDRPGLLKQMRDLLGGWPGLATLGTACAAGIWLGAALPSDLPFATGTDDTFTELTLDPLFELDVALLDG